MLLTVTNPVFFSAWVWNLKKQKKTGGDKQRLLNHNILCTSVRWQEHTHAHTPLKMCLCEIPHSEKCTLCCWRLYFASVVTTRQKSLTCLLHIVSFLVSVSAVSSMNLWESAGSENIRQQRWQVEVMWLCQHQEVNYSKKTSGFGFRTRAVTLQCLRCLIVSQKTQDLTWIQDSLCKSLRVRYSHFHNFIFHSGLRWSSHIIQKSPDKPKKCIIRPPFLPDAEKATVCPSAAGFSLQGGLRRCNKRLAEGFISPLYDITKALFPEMYTLSGKLLCCGRHYVINRLLLLENAGEVKFARCGTFNKQSRLSAPSPWCHYLKRGVQVQVPLLIWHVHFPLRAHLCFFCPLTPI